MTCRVCGCNIEPDLITGREVANSAVQAESSLFTSWGSEGTQLLDALFEIGVSGPLARAGCQARRVCMVPEKVNLAVHSSEVCIAQVGGSVGGGIGSETMQRSSIQLN